MSLSPKTELNLGKSNGSHPSASDAAPLTTLDSALLKEVTVALSAKVGETSMTIKDLLALKTGEIVKLNAGLNDLVELHLNQCAIARGELVAIGDNFGIRIVEISENR